MPKEKPSREAVTLYSLRFAAGWKQRELATQLGFSVEKQLTRYESEGKKLSREYLDKLVAPLGLAPEAPDVLLWALGLIFPEPEVESAADSLALTQAERRRIDRTALTAGWSSAEGVREQLVRRKREQKAMALRREAEDLAPRLGSASSEDRTNLLAVFPEFRTWAVAERLSHASARAAAHNLERAQELAELALEVARKIPGEAERARTEGYCTGFLASVQRVSTEFEKADATVSLSWKLWRAGQVASSLPLAESRLLDLEASLRREQRRFSEALELLDQALQLCGGDATGTARILLKKEHVFEAMGDVQGALGALREATPHVETSGDPRLLFALRFKIVNNLCHLGRYGEAATQLPLVRTFAVENGDELSLIRVLWLGSKVAAGQGRIEEAKAALEQVRAEFTTRMLPYEAALSSLDLALLLLQEGRTTEVRDLAIAMTWIFEAKGITREASASLSLFCEAARQQTATVEMAMHILGEINDARPSASRSSRR